MRMRGRCRYGYFHPPMSHARNRLLCTLLPLAASLAGCAAPPPPATRPGVAPLALDDGGLAVQRVGDSIHVRGRGIDVTLPAQEWRVLEESPRRFRVVNADGQPLTILPDGRAWFEGEPRRADDRDVTAAQTAAAERPGRIEVPESQGRPDRRTEGDANDDGFNEARGAYQVVAAGRQVDLTLVPVGAALPDPLVEIYGLPPGEVIATTGGRLISSVGRLADGRVLVEVPFTVRGPRTVAVQVR